jgi:soluble lytic murein transglycosylase
MPAVHADHWVEAQELASRFADPLPEKIIYYYRLLAPGAATASEIADFMASSPDWPYQAILEKRRQEAIAQEPDDSVVLTQCALLRPSLPAALLRCAQALSVAGREDEARNAAREAWVSGLNDQADEAAFLHRWPGVADAPAQWERFDALAWHDTKAASRQVARLDPAHRKAAQARLALKKEDPSAMGLVTALPAPEQTDPGLVLDEVRYLRRADRLADAANLWASAGNTAQKAAPGHAGSFWAERNLLARKLLQQGQNQEAYRLVAHHGLTEGEPLLDAEFLAGFIALRRLNDPKLAAPHFSALDAASQSAITQARAHFWLGRAAQQPDQARAEFDRAAAYPTTFYGQLAALAAGQDNKTLAARINALRDPQFTRDAALGFLGHEVVRAAAWLVAWGEPRRARAFLLRMDELAAVPADRVMAATLASDLGVPDVAVFIARRMGRDGLMLPRAGWPAPYTPPEAVVDPAVSLGIMRQESSFDIGAVSPSGARGLMQLMPPTAQDVARQLGTKVSIAALTTNAGQNMQLGSTYISDMLTRFDGSLPVAVAAYNAGPGRVGEWLVENGDPRTGKVDMLDWIELIPKNETRNYVQRVLENIVIYRAHRGEMTPALLAQWVRDQ